MTLRHITRSPKQLTRAFGVTSQHSPPSTFFNKSILNSKYGFKGDVKEGEKFGEFVFSNGRWQEISAAAAMPSHNIAVSATTVKEETTEMEPEMESMNDSPGIATH